MTRLGSLRRPQLHTNEVGGAGPSLRSSRPGWLGAVAARPLLAREIEEQVNRFFFPFEMMDLLLSSLADPSPLTREAGVTEQRHGNLHDVVTGHSPGGIRAFDIKMVWLSQHAGRIGISALSVQRDL